MAAKSDMSPSFLSRHPLPERIRLDEDEVHLWYASLDLGASKAQRLTEILSEDERKRGERFYFQRDRERFVAARGQLRSLLAGYLGLKPGELRFRYGPYGKPNLVFSRSGMLRFNLSHSDELVLYAVARDREIGVDLERVRADVPYEVAERFFSPRERAALRELPSDLRRTAFYTLWTSKEAYLKARGVGLSLPLNGIDISPALKSPTTLLEIQDDLNDTTRWMLRGLAPAPGYRAALVVENHYLKLEALRWSVYRM